MNTVFQSIARYIPLSEELKVALQKRMLRQTFKKKDLVLDADTVCKSSFFIEKGIMRLFFLKDGKEITEFFCSENEWMNSPKSFMLQIPDQYYIDVVEDTIAWQLNVADLVYLFEHFPEMEKYARMDMGSTFGYIMERLASIRFTTAAEKYQHFLTTYSDMYHRIPLGMVASYVGIAQETLSRLRKETIF